MIFLSELRTVVVVLMDGVCRNFEEEREERQFEGWREETAGVWFWVSFF